MALQLGLIASSDVPTDDMFSGLRIIDENGCEAPDRLKDDFARFYEQSLSDSEQWGLTAGFNSSSSYGEVMARLFHQLLQTNRGQYSELDIKILKAMFEVGK